MVLFDASILLPLLDPSVPAPLDEATGDPVTDVERRIRYLVSSLDEARTKIVIPTPALAEVLTGAEKAGADYLTKLSRSSAFRIEPFNIRAAVEVARMTATAISDGDKKSGLAAPWQKIKYDRQIVAIAIVTSVSAVYSGDGDVRRIAEDHGIRAVAISELPLPPEDQQMTFAWDAGDEEEPEEE